MHQLAAALAAAAVHAAHVIIEKFLTRMIGFDGLGSEYRIFLRAGLDHGLL